MQPQEKQDSKEIYLEAESYFLYEEYTEALPLYLKLIKKDPENDNLGYKIGVCYLNIPYEKEKSIAYLEKASKNINLRYKADNIKERQAPLDALYYLGSAYRVNNQLDKAYEIYSDFKNKVDPSVYDISLVEEQLKSIERARKLENKPIYFVTKNLGEMINSRFSESNPVVTPDESIIIYNVKLQFYDALFFSKKVKGEWSGPVNIIPELGVDGDVYATSISSDGKKLYIYRSDNFDGNLYVSEYVNNRWTPIKRLNDNINTKYWESHASISNDGKTLYFTSNRDGGYGGLDIYKATKNEKGEWVNVTNLGPQINSPFNEDTPFPSEDGKVLYYSSYSHYNMGGYDIFYATLLDNGKWSTPLNMGYPLNTTDDDVFFMPVQNGNFGYVARYYEDGYGKTDIYRIELFSEQHPRKFILNGLVSLPYELKNDDLKLVAKLVNKVSRDTIQLINIDPDKAKFDTKIIAGNYQLIIEGKGLQTAIEDFKIDKDQKSDEINVSATLRALPKETLAVNKPVEKVEEIILPIAVERKFYKVFDNAAIPIKLKLPVGSSVKVDIYIDTFKTDSKSFVTNKERHIYNYLPVPGKNVLDIGATDLNGQKYKTSVVIYYEDLPDTVNKEDIAKILAEKQNKVNQLKFMLAAISDTALRDVILSVDAVKEKISEEKELVDLLVSKGLNPGELDSLLNLIADNGFKAKLHYVTALKAVSGAELRPALEKADADSMKSFDEMVATLIAETKGNSELTMSLLSSTARLADAGTVYYYLNSLRLSSSGSLKAKADSVDLNRDNISTPEGLYNSLTSQTSKDGYSKEQLATAFFAISPIEAPVAKVVELLKKRVSDEEINVFVTKYLDERPPFASAAEVYGYLIQKAVDAGIDIDKLSMLFIDVNNKLSFDQLLDDIKVFADKNIVKSIELSRKSEESVNTSIELMNYLISKSKNKNLTEELIKVYSNIAYKNFIKLELKKPKETDIKAPAPGFLFISVISVALVLALVLLVLFIRNRQKN